MMGIFNLILLLLFLLDFGLGCEDCSLEVPGDCDFSGSKCDGWNYSNASVTDNCNGSTSNSSAILNNGTNWCLLLKNNEAINSRLTCFDNTCGGHHLSFDFDFSQGAIMTLTVEIFSHDPRCQYNRTQINFKVLDSRNSSGWTRFQLSVNPNNNFTVNISAQGSAGKVLIANISYERFPCVLPTTEEHVLETTDYRTTIATTDKPSTSTPPPDIVAAYLYHIIGSSVAVVVCVALCIIILVICKRKRRGRDRKLEDDNANEDQEENSQNNPFQETASSRGDLNNTTNQGNLHQELPSFNETAGKQATGYDYEEVNIDAARQSGSNPTPGPNVIDEYSHLDISGKTQHHKMDSRATHAGINAYSHVAMGDQGSDYSVVDRQKKVVVLDGEYSHIQ